MLWGTKSCIFFKTRKSSLFQFGLRSGLKPCCQHEVISILTLNFYSVMVSDLSLSSKLSGS